MLQLTKPLAIIDIEATGMNLGTDKIVEIAMVRIQTDGSKSVKRKLLNPEMPIPPSITELNGINDQIVKDAPTFRQVANEIKQFLENCDLAGYNSYRLDIPLLAEEFLRTGLEFEFRGRKLIDVQKIFHLM